MKDARPALDAELEELDGKLEELDAKLEAEIAKIPLAAKPEHPMDRALRKVFPGVVLPAFGSAAWDRAAEAGIADEERRRELYLAKHPELAAELAAIDARLKRKGRR